MSLPDVRDRVCEPSDDAEHDRRLRPAGIRLSSHLGPTLRCRGRYVLRCLDPAQRLGFGAHPDIREDYSTRTDKQREPANGASTNYVTNPEVRVKAHRIS